MNLLDSSRFDAIADLVGDTPFTATPYFFLQRRACDVYAGDAMPPRCVAIVPHTPLPDVYVLGATSLASTEMESLADFLGRLDIDGGVYTLPRYRNRGYASDCVEALFARAFDLGVRPLWRIGVRQKVAIYPPGSCSQGQTVLW
jgi:GNAT superfamily N-acetyltransferase